jgi:hypothetical protein
MHAPYCLAGSFIRDIYVILANEPGLLLGTYMTITSYGFAPPKVGLCVFVIGIEKGGRGRLRVHKHQTSENCNRNCTNIHMVLCLVLADTRHGRH